MLATPSVKETLSSMWTLPRSMRSPMRCTAPELAARASGAEAGPAEGEAAVICRRSGREAVFTRRMGRDGVTR